MVWVRGREVGEGEQTSVDVLLMFLHLDMMTITRPTA